MEFKEVIDKRRTIRDFQGKEIPPKVLDYAIGNGFKAPTYNHLREWDFILIKTPEAKLQLIESENLEKEIDIKKLEKLFEKEDAVKKRCIWMLFPNKKE